jgi:hypothetical protein
MARKDSGAYKLQVLHNNHNPVFTSQTSSAE